MAYKVIQRLITGATLGVASLGWILYSPAWLFFSILIVLFTLLTKEVFQLTQNKTPPIRTFFSIFYLAPTLLVTWSIYTKTPLEFLWIVAVVASTDIGAYVFGKIFGKHKIATSISPNKSWEGLAGGMILSALTGLILFTYLKLSFFEANMFYLAAFCAIIACIAQGGDFFASHIKRKAGVKDSGTLLPGHGGLLDRFDGYLFAIPFFWSCL